MIPNIVVFFEDEKETEGIITSMINSIKNYKGMANIYTL